jgi:hydrogenase expression/formation protein HypC
MCLAIPGKILELENTTAKIDFNGIKRKADTSLVDDVTIGDYVLVHVGYAIQKVDEEVARESYRLLADLEEEDTKD